MVVTLYNHWGMRVRKYNITLSTYTIYYTENTTLEPYDKCLGYKVNIAPDINFTEFYLSNIAVWDTT